MVPFLEINVLFALKEPGPIASDFAFKLSLILVSEESSFFSHYPWWISQLKLNRLEDINENVTSYGNHNYVYTVRHRQKQNTQSLFVSPGLYPNGLIDLTEIWNHDFLCNDASFE